MKEKILLIWLLLFTLPSFPQDSKSLVVANGDGLNPSTSQFNGRKLQKKILLGHRATDIILFNKYFKELNKDLDLEKLNGFGIRLTLPNETYEIIEGKRAELTLYNPYTSYRDTTRAEKTFLLSLEKTKELIAKFRDADCFSANEIPINGFSIDGTSATIEITDKNRYLMANQQIRYGFAAIAIGFVRTSFNEAKLSEGFNKKMLSQLKPGLYRKDGDISIIKIDYLLPKSAFKSTAYKYVENILRKNYDISKKTNRENFPYVNFPDDTITGLSMAKVNRIELKHIKAVAVASSYFEDKPTISVNIFLNTAGDIIDTLKATKGNYFMDKNQPKSTAYSYFKNLLKEQYGISEKTKPENLPKILIWNKNDTTYAKRPVNLIALNILEKNQISFFKITQLFRPNLKKTVIKLDVFLKNNQD